MSDATIVQQALAIHDPLERKRFLALACAGDPTLIQEIENLISFLRSPLTP